jgi:MFS family permease
MSRFQVAIVALCICIAGLDGFDVLVVAFTAPEIAKEWALNPAALGGLFSAGLAGMGFGALLIAPLGDKLGRRPTVLLCLVILVLGMFGASFARTLGELAALRFFTGLGIGGVLANINIVVAEYSSARRRDLCVALMSVGYPIGATLGGCGGGLSHPRLGMAFGLCVWRPGRLGLDPGNAPAIARISRLPAGAATF